MTLDKRTELEEFDVVRREGTKWTLLGRIRSFFRGDVLYEAVYDTSTGQFLREDSFREVRGAGDALVSTIWRERSRKTREYYQKANQLRGLNMADLTEAIKDIRVYQGTIDEVSQDLGMKLERVDRGEPETFIRADDTFWLRVGAYALGANAIVHYQPGSSIGTPVRYITKK